MGHYNKFKGENFNWDLTIVEIAKKVREYIKDKYLGFKFSVRIQKFSMGRSLYVQLKDIPLGTNLINVDLVKHVQKTKEPPDNVNDWQTDEIKSMMADIKKYANSFNRTESHIQSDYYSTNFYLHMNISADLQKKHGKAEGFIT